jgi:hypothetical protein
VRDYLAAQALKQGCSEEMPRTAACSIQLNAAVGGSRRPGTTAHDERRKLGMEAQTRVVHCKREAFDIYIGRPSKWGNPFSIGKDGDRREVLSKYTAWIVTQKHLMESLHELRGQVLGCWCAPNPCHGHILAHLAAGLDIESALRLTLESAVPVPDPAQASLF